MMNLFVMNLFSKKSYPMSPMLLTHYYMAEVKSGEGYPIKVARFGLNRAYMKIRKPNLPCTEYTLFVGHFYGFLRFVVWKNSGHFWGVYQSHYCASEGAFPFSFVYVMYLNIASYLYGRQIKSKLRNRLYLWMILISVHLNLHECPTMNLKSRLESRCLWHHENVTVSSSSIMSLNYNG